MSKFRNVEICRTFNYFITFYLSTFLQMICYSLLFIHVYTPKTQIELTHLLYISTHTTMMSCHRVYQLLR